MEKKHWGPFQEVLGMVEESTGEIEDETESGIGFTRSI